jgi:hypothetical protein
VLLGVDAGASQATREGHVLATVAANVGSVPTQLTVDQVLSTTCNNVSDST